MKENSERLEWLQIHTDLHTEEKALQEKITFNSLTNSVGPRKFLHCGILTKTKSEKELVCFLFNDFLLLTTANNQSFNGHQFSFDKHHGVNLKLYRQVTYSDLNRNPEFPFSQCFSILSRWGRVSGKMKTRLGFLSFTETSHSALTPFIPTTKPFGTRS